MKFVGTDGLVYFVNPARVECVSGRPEEASGAVVFASGRTFTFDISANQKALATLLEALNK